MRFVDRYGPWAVVTGASSGIGRAIAIDLARRGLNLVLVARRTEELQALAREIPTEARILSLDLAELGAAARLDAETRDLDIGLLVSSAGFGTSGSFLDGELAREVELLDVNCRATLELTHRFANRMRSNRKRGGLILLGSLVGFQGVPRAAHYAASKAYIQSLAEGLHAELKPFGIDVLSAAPGPVQTGFGERAKMTMASALRPEQIAGPILDALGKRTTVVPGPLSKVLGVGLAMLPRPMRVRVMTTVMAGMTKGNA